MKKILIAGLLMGGVVLWGCNTETEDQTTTTARSAGVQATSPGGQSGVADDVSNPDVVKVAVSSPDHTTLVKAVQAAGLVDALSNAGPFTVFAPTNAAFDKLPAGTVENLLKPANKDDLEDILGYHTYVGVLDGVLFQDGKEYDMVYGGKVKITKDGNDVFVNGNKIVGSIKAANGIIHVIEEVLLPN